MTKRISLNIFFSLLILFVLQKESFSQNRDSILVLTLKDAVTMSLERNWDVQISQKDILKAEEQINEAYSNAYPRLDFTGRYSRNIKLPVMFISPNTGFRKSGFALFEFSFYGLEKFFSVDFITARSLSRFCVNSYNNIFY